MILEGSYPRLPLGFIRLASRTIPCNPDWRQVFSSRHSLANACEQLEVLLLTGKQWIRLEMRNDSGDQDRKASHLPFKRLVAPVWS